MTMRSRSEEAVSRLAPSEPIPSTTAPQPGPLPCLTAKASITRGQMRATTAQARSAYWRPASSALVSPWRWVDSYAEPPLLHPTPRCIEPRLVIARLRKSRDEERLQPLPPRPRGEEAAADHGVEHARVARQVPRERGRGGRDLHHQTQKAGIRLEERKELDARGEPREELGRSSATLPPAGRPRAGGARSRGGDGRRSPAPVRSGSGIGGPAATTSAPKWSSLAGALTPGEEALGQGLHLLETGGEVAAEGWRGPPP
jgi:hypothetical protein